MITFSREVRESLAEASHYFCQRRGCLNLGEEYHHKVPNTINNQKKYPLFLQSPFNAVFICKQCHENYSSHPDLNMSDNLAKVYENYLKGEIK